ncbi:MAG: C1 family peptidase, partial [Flavobacteriales bacterium]
NKGFSSSKGLALVPKDESIKVNDLKEPIEEIEITQELRQEKFDKHIVTDDHLMHITGITEDEDGNTFFIVKNSWGVERGMEGFEGHIFVSEAYFKLNTISVTLHKTALHYRK